MGGEGQTYSLSVGRSQHHGHILTPSSAVSSFNLPAACDSTLNTPVGPNALDGHQKITERTSMHKSMDLKVSPIVLSPGYLCGDDEDFAYRPREMKFSDRYMAGGLGISTNDAAFPASPLVCSSPFYGHFGVSHPPQSAAASHSSSSVQQSPQLVSAGGFSNISNDSRNSRVPTPALTPSPYTPAQPTPILLAPNPSTYRPPGKTTSPRYVQGSLASNHFPPRSGSRQESFPTTLGSVHSRVKKVKRKCSNEAIFSILIERDMLNEEELFIVQGRLNNAINWKDLTKRFNKKFNQSMQTAALQMRKQRLGFRYKDLLNNPCSYNHECEDRYRRGSSDSFEETFKYVPEYDEAWREIYPDTSMHITVDARAWSDGSSSATQSLPDEESANLYQALSPASTLRSRAGSDAGFGYHLPRQNQYLDQQHQQQNLNSWHGIPSLRRS